MTYFEQICEFRRNNNNKLTDDQKWFFQCLAAYCGGMGPESRNCPAAKTFLEALLSQ